MSFIDRTTEFQSLHQSLVAPSRSAQRRRQSYLPAPVEMPAGLIEVFLLVVTAGMAELLIFCLVTGVI